MPAATASPAARTEKEEQLWIALKRHIMRERQRKKEEQEAEVEEERLRKEREAREKQDEMTLGETRDQIQLFDTKLEELKNEKKQLFLKLKKVLNEDDNRKRQLHKESNEMFAIQNLQQQQNAPPPQFFLPPRVPHHQHIQKNAAGQIVGNNPQLKRGRSPSPPQGYYKSGNQQQYSQIPKLEEGRRGGESNRAVLWNKPTQYSNSPGTLFYPNSPSNPPDTRPHPILFSAYGNINIPIRQNYMPDIQQPVSNQPPPKNDNKQPPPGTVYHINLDPPNVVPQQAPQQPTQIIPQPSHKNQVTMEKVNDRSGYHIEMKHDDRKDVRSSQPSQSHIPEGLVYSTQSLRHMPMHSSVMPQNQQPNKGGSITQGYASRPQNQQQMQQQQQQQPPQVHYPRHRYQ